MENKHLVAFLGNPGKQYEHSRHNAAWIVADTLFPNLVFSFDKYSNSEIAHTDASYLEIHSASTYRAAETRRVNAEMLLVKPQTFMNLSGDAVGHIAKKESIDTSKIIVVYDDIDVPVGEFRITVGGGSNHNGIKSMFSRFGRDGFVRLRVGVGDSDRAVPLRGYVLGDLTPDQMQSLKEVSFSISDALVDIIQHGVVYAQNKYHKK